MKLIKSYGETDFVTGMRAIAALMVVVIHTGGAGLRSLGPIGNAIADLGPSGVIVFFVISGFSVASSYELSGSFAQYLTRRLLRILPLFYFWLLFMWVRVGLNAPSFGEYLDGPSTYRLLMWIPLLHYLDAGIPGFIGVEWTLSVEVFWYLALPLLLLAIRGRLSALVALPIAFEAYKGLMELMVRHPIAINVPPGGEVAAFQTSPLAYVFSFTIGVAVYRLRHAALDKFGDAAFLLVAIALALHLGDRPRYTLHDPIIFVSVLAAICILFGSRRSYICRFVLANPVALFLGTISYGLYLSHLPVAYTIDAWGIARPATFAMFCATTLGSIVVSTVTYLLIERPFQQIRFTRRSVLPDAETASDIIPAADKRVAEKA